MHNGLADAPSAGFRLFARRWLDNQPAEALLHQFDDDSALAIADGVELAATIIRDEGADAQNARNMRACAGDGLEVFHQVAWRFGTRHRTYDMIERHDYPVARGYHPCQSLNLHNQQSLILIYCNMCHVCLSLPHSRFLLNNYPCCDILPSPNGRGFSENACGTPLRYPPKAVPRLVFFSTVLLLPVEFQANLQHIACAVVVSIQD